ncbi:DUF397 domain-containing protein [Micromonospora coxensis]
MTDLTGAVWRRSTRSGGIGGNCVEVATNLPGIVAIRDSKDPAGPVLAVGGVTWHRFTTAVTTGQFHKRGPGPAVATSSLPRTAMPGRSLV